MNRKGFTLIELMIVVAIIGILMAIAIPKFADLSKQAQRVQSGRTETITVRALAATESLEWQVKKINYQDSDSVQFEAVNGKVYTVTAPFVIIEG